MDFYWFIAVLIVFHLVRYYLFNSNSEKDDKEADELLEKNRKEELKKLFTDRELRTNLEEFNESEFWELVEKLKFKSDNNYKNFNGLLRDNIISMSTDKIVQLDNLVERLFIERYSYDILYTSYIILKRGDIDGMMFLMNLFLFKGEVFFKNACINTNLCTGKNFEFFGDDRLIFDLTGEAYAIKENKFIPYTKQKDIVLKGEAIEENEIPRKYSELWNEFF
ncbi:hypothetical protein [Polaribacter sp. Asnod6-C07]|uniref:hypothetical protein n=1 Tax=Polaribacter sp. Asnod6-C07 TaxID=3160582 RepID=UPI0038707A47